MPEENNNQKPVPSRPAIANTFVPPPPARLANTFVPPPPTDKSNRQKLRKNLSPNEKAEKLRSLNEKKKNKEITEEYFEEEKTKILTDYEFQIHLEDINEKFLLKNFYERKSLQKIILPCTRRAKTT